MSDDPNAPGYTPGYEPGGRGEGAGSGTEFGADLHAMYHAGRVRFPEIAQVFFDATEDLWYAQLPVEGVSGDMDDPPAMRKLLRIRKDLQLAAYLTTDRSTKAGVALVGIAYDFVSTDQAALTEFNRVKDSPEMQGEYREPTPEVGVPHHPDDERPEPPPQMPEGVF